MSLRRAALLACTLLTVACAQTFDATSLGVPVTMASPAGEAPQGDPFSVRQSQVYMFWGLLTLTTPDLQKVLATQLIGGKSVSNLKIKIYSRWSDLLITGLTLGAIVPRSVKFEGIVSGGAQPPPP